MTMSKVQKAQRLEEKQQAVKDLVEIFNIHAGQRIFCEVVHRSTSGMQHHLRVFCVKGDDILAITNPVAKACGFRIKPRWQGDVITINGCGFDKCFEIVSTLGQVMFQNPDCLVKEQL